MFGIVGYGAYVPCYRIRTAEIAAQWGRASEGEPKGKGLVEKTVPGLDEDTITISVEAGRHALSRAGIDARRIGALYIGSESHPYAVKPSGTVVAEALGIGREVHVADFEFACKAGTEADYEAAGLSSFDLAFFPRRQSGLVGGQRSSSWVRHAWAWTSPLGA